MTNYRKKTRVLVKAANHVLRTRKQFYKSAAPVGIGSGNLGRTISVVPKLFKTMSKTKKVGDISNASNFNPATWNGMQNDLAVADLTHAGASLTNRAFNPSATARPTITMPGASPFTLTNVLDATGRTIGVGTGVVQAGQAFNGFQQNLNDIRQGTATTDTYNQLGDNTAQMMTGMSGAGLAALGSVYAAPVLTVPWFLDAKERVTPQTTQQMDAWMDRQLTDPNTGERRPMNWWDTTKYVGGHMATNAINAGGQMGYDLDYTLDPYIFTPVQNWWNGTDYDNIQQEEQNLAESEWRLKRQQQNNQKVFDLQRAKALTGLWDTTMPEHRAQVFENESPEVLQLLNERSNFQAGNPFIADKYADLSRGQYYTRQNFLHEPNRVYYGQGNMVEDPTVPGGWREEAPPLTIYGEYKQNEWQKQKDKESSDLNARVLYPNGVPEGVEVDPNMWTAAQDKMRLEQANDPYLQARMRAQYPNLGLSPELQQTSNDINSHIQQFENEHLPQSSGRVTDPNVEFRAQQLQSQLRSPLQQEMDELDASLQRIEDDINANRQGYGQLPQFNNYYH